MPRGLFLRFGFSALILFIVTQRLIAQTPPKIATCTACHGQNGISPNGLWPNLAGQKAQYLEKSLKDYRDGRRQDVLMAPLAKILSDKEIHALADYYSNLSHSPIHEP